MGGTYHDITPPPWLGSGEVAERYAPLVPPKPLPWYYTNQTALAFWFILAIYLMLCLAVSL